MYESQRFDLSRADWPILNCNSLSDHCQRSLRKGGERPWVGWDTKRLLTDLEVEDVVRAHRFPAVLVKVLDVHWDRQTLQLAAALSELVDPLRRGSSDDPNCSTSTARLSVYCLSSLIANRVS